MAVFLKHKNCNNCGSSDARAVYNDGSEYCWSCTAATLSDEYKQAIKKGKQVQEKPAKDKPFITDEEVREILENTAATGKNFRKISDETYKKFKVRHEFNQETGDVQKQYYPITTDYEFSGYKVRTVPKGFFALGNNSVNSDLFGQILFKGGGRHVLLSEGECFLPDTKVLTRNGWVTLEEYKIEKHGEVMQGDGKLALPLAKIFKPYNGTLVKYKSGSYEVTTTPKHKMLRLRGKVNLYCHADDLKLKHLPVPRTITFDSNSDDLKARLQVMFSADFTFRVEGDIYGRLKKDRKVQRAKQLLDASGIRYVCNLDSEGCSSFFIHRGHGLDVSKLFSYTRDLPSAMTIIDEVLHWDGNCVPNRNQIEYSTKILANAEFVQTCAHLCGYVSTIIPRHSSLGSWFKVSILFGKQTSSTQNGYKQIEYCGNVACLTMPSGTLLVKQGQSISVSGNCDAMAAYQVLRGYYVSKGSDYDVACVSPTTGVKGVKQVQKAYKFFDSFDNIVLCLDSDEAGQESVDDYIKALPRGKVKIMQMRLKDANEYLEQGRHQEFIKDFWNAKKYIPVGIVDSSSLFDAVYKGVQVEKIPLPPFMKKAAALLSDIELGTIGVFGAGSGAAKTTVANECLYYWLFNSPHKVGVVSLELTAAQYGQAILSRHTGQKISLITSVEGKLAFLDNEAVKLKAQEVFTTEDGQGRFALIDDRDGSIEELKNRIEELIISCNCKLIILDPVSDIFEGMPIEEQAGFMKWLKSQIKAHGVTFILIGHIRKASSNKDAASAGNFSPEEALHGSSSLFKSASWVLMMQRDKYHEDPVERNTTYLTLTKNRSTGETGKAGELYYDNKTHTLHDKETWLQENMPSTIE